MNRGEVWRNGRYPKFTNSNTVNIERTLSDL